MGSNGTEDRKETPPPGESPSSPELLPLNSSSGANDASTAMDDSSFPLVATSMASPEDMEYHRASASTSSALESSIQSLVDTASVAVSATPFSGAPVTVSTLFTAAAAEAVTATEDRDYEVIDGTTIYFDGPPPATSTSHLPKISHATTTDLPPIYAYDDVEYEDLSTKLPSSSSRGWSSTSASTLSSTTATELSETDQGGTSTVVVQDSEGKGPDGMSTRTSTRTKFGKKRTKRSISYEEREIAESNGHYWAAGFGGGRVSGR